MSREEWQRMSLARRDPAVNYLLLLPLALIHLSGRRPGQGGAFALIEQALAPLGGAGVWLLSGLLAVVFVWSVGRIRLLGLPWRGGGVLLVAEGVLWGLLLAPVLRWLTALVSQAMTRPLALEWSEVHARLSLAAGAGLYEEILFRAILLNGLYILFGGFFGALASRGAARTFSFGLALLVSSLLFSLAHALGDEEALQAGPFIFRLLAGALLGALFAGRGLAVVAYAHAAYDARILL